MKLLSRMCSMLKWLVMKFIIRQTKLFTDASLTDTDLDINKLFINRFLIFPSTRIQNIHLNIANAPTMIQEVDIVTYWVVDDGFEALSLASPSRFLAVAILFFCNKKLHKRNIFRQVKCYNNCHKPNTL